MKGLFTDVKVFMQKTIVFGWIFLYLFYILNTTGARENSVKPEETRSAAGGLVPQGGRLHTLPPPASMENRIE